PGDAAAFVNQAHAGLVDLGLTVPPTKAGFAKRVTVYPGGEAAFVLEYQSTPYRAITRVLIDWLGFRVSEAFEPSAVLAEINRRLSSFNLTIEMKDVSWLDEELNLRKAKLRFGDQERVVRFKDARDLMKSMNEMLATRKIAFLELETWGDDFAFLLVREPRWDKLSNPELVVVKADQTANGGECGACGARVGRCWSDWRGVREPSPLDESTGRYEGSAADRRSRATQMVNRPWEPVRLGAGLRPDRSEREPSATRAAGDRQVVSEERQSSRSADSRRRLRLP